MHLFTMIALLSFSSLAAADNYANFFDDDNCKENGGIGVNINNDGCLAQSGRGSVYIPVGTTFASLYCLVETDESSKCNCQSNGYEFNPTGFCHKLNKKNKSYRFINEPCGKNNC